MRHPRRRKNLPYSQGDLNRLVDSVVHPLIKGDAKIPAMVLDTELHFIIEQDIESSVKKFIRYSLPGIVSDVAKSDVAKPKKVKVLFEEYRKGRQNETLRRA